LYLPIRTGDIFLRRLPRVSTLSLEPSSRSATPLCLGLFLKDLKLKLEPGSSHSLPCRCAGHYLSIWRTPYKSISPKCTSRSIFGCTRWLHLLLYIIIVHDCQVPCRYTGAKLGGLSILTIKTIILKVLVKFKIINFIPGVDNCTWSYHLRHFLPQNRFDAISG
jgi:hypothetical protein